MCISFTLEFPSWCSWMTTNCLLYRVLAEKGKEVMFVRPKKLIRTSGTEALGYVDIRTLAEGMCRYDLNEQDVAWLQIANEEFAEMGESQLPVPIFIFMSKCF